MAGLLLIVAHPDDEFFCAGALAAMREKNVPVTVAYWTRGEGGGNQRFRQLYSLLPSFCQPRVFEAKKSMRCLKITKWLFLDYKDQTFEGKLSAPVHNPVQFRSELRQLMESVKPELVMTHGSDGEYGHPAHIILHASIREVLHDWKQSPGLVTFCAAPPGEGPRPCQNQSDPAGLVLDSLAYTDQKNGVVEAHASQKNVWPILVPEAKGSLKKAIEFFRLEYYHGGILSSQERDLGLFKDWTGALTISQP